MSKDKIIKQNGLFVVKAGPGCGKTTCVANRFAELLKDWQYFHRGIATISFTNVAWKKIEEILLNTHNIKTAISYPHFLGTIDSFINQYIFLPFGHLVMECIRRPELVGPPYNDWEPTDNYFFWGERECTKNKCKLNYFSYNINNELYNTSQRSHFNKCSIEHSRCEKLKKAFNQKGYATQLDANYFAYKILTKFPQIAKAISFRFPFLMVDEAQDTSEIQMKIIDLLIEKGLKEVMLIGDPDQAIFEWRAANPDLFKKKYDKWNHIDLKDNYRSSQIICDFFSKISSFSSPLKAVNEDCKSFYFVPKIYKYTDISDCGEIIQKFLEVCEDYKIVSNSKNIAILSRSGDLLKDIKGINKNSKGLLPWKEKDSITKNIARSKYLYDKEKYSEAFRTLERSICDIEKNKVYSTRQDMESIIKKYGFVNWRKRIYKIISLFPSTLQEKQIGRWVKLSKEILEKNKGSIGLDQNIELKIKRNYQNKHNYTDLFFDDIFGKKEARTDENKYTIGTVHSVKGETFDAVILFVKHKAGNKGNYSKVLSLKIEENEEVRTVYVAITRPRKVLIIAVPEVDKASWESVFLDNLDNA